MDPCPIFDRDLSNENRYFISGYLAGMEIWIEIHSIRVLRVLLESRFFERRNRPAASFEERHLRNGERAALHDLIYSRNYFFIPLEELRDEIIRFQSELESGIKLKIARWAFLQRTGKEFQP